MLFLIFTCLLKTFFIFSNQRLFPNFGQVGGGKNIFLSTFISSLREINKFKNST